MARFLLLVFFSPFSPFFWSFLKALLFLHSLPYAGVDLDLDLSSFHGEGESLQQLSRPFWKRFHSFILSSLPSLFSFCTDLLRRHTARFCLAENGPTPALVELTIWLSSKLLHRPAVWPWPKAYLLNCFSVAASILDPEEGLGESIENKQGKNNKEKKKCCE